MFDTTAPPAIGNACTIYMIEAEIEIYWSTQTANAIGLLLWFSYTMCLYVCNDVKFNYGDTHDDDITTTSSVNWCKLVRNQLLLPDANYLARYLTRYFEQEHCRWSPTCLA